MRHFLTVFAACLGLLAPVSATAENERYDLTINVRVKVVGDSALIPGPVTVQCEITEHINEEVDGESWTRSRMHVERVVEAAGGWSPNAPDNVYQYSFDLDDYVSFLQEDGVERKEYRYRCIGRWRIVEGSPPRAIYPYLAGTRVLAEGVINQDGTYTARPGPAAR